MLAQRRIIGYEQNEIVGVGHDGRIDAQPELIHLRKLVPKTPLLGGGGQINVPVFEPSPLLIGAAHDVLEKLYPDRSRDHQTGIIQGIDSLKKKLDTIRCGVVVKTLDPGERLYDLNSAGHQQSEQFSANGIVRGT